MPSYGGKYDRSTHQPSTSECGMRRACLPLLLLSFGTCAPEQDREAYVRARKDGGWDAHCDAAYARLTGAAFSGLDAGVARRGRGVVFSAAGGAEFARREVAPAAAAVAKLRESAAWPGDARVALFAEPAVLRALAAEARGAFDVVQRHDAAAVGLELRGRSPAFRAKALKILAMARAPFEETVYLDFDSKPCAPNFVETILAFLRDGADVALADNYAGQGALAPRDHYQREHASGCVALRSASERTRSLLAAYLEAFLLLEKTPRGRRDQPALMVALRRSVENGLRDAPIPPSVFCRKNTSRTVSCDACVVAHKTAKYDLSFKIFGIGFKKTGTTSLAAALQRLKIGPEPSHRQSVAATVALLRPGEDASLALDAARGARSFSDAPWCMAATRGRLLERLFDTYPRAKFVLTTRPSREWWQSVRNWLFCLKPWNAERYARMLNAASASEADLVAAYERANAKVRAFFAERGAGDRLLELELSSATGRAFPWARLCAFVEAWGRCPAGDEVGRTYAKNAYETNEFGAKHPSEALGADDLRRCAALQGSPDGAALRRRAERLAEASPLAARRRERDAASPPE